MNNEHQHNFNLLPSIDEINQIISEIQDADFSKLSFNKLFRKIQALKFIAFPTTLLKKGFHIERGRINNTDELFYSEKDLSYRTDFNNIKKYGRANVPENPLFYGAIESDIIKHPRFVNLLETSEIFRNLNENTSTDADFIITVGKWKILEDIEIVEVVFDENSIKNSKDVEDAFNYHLEKLQKDYPEHVEKFSLILRFFSNEFAKKDISSHYDYMVSALYTYMGIEMQGHKGIKYPSVKTDYQGHNIVLTPTTVENFLELEMASMFRVVKKRKETVVIPIKHCTEFGSMNTNFKWEDVEQKEFTV